MMTKERDSLKTKMGKRTLTHRTVSLLHSRTYNFKCLFCLHGIETRDETTHIHMNCLFTLQIRMNTEFLHAFYEGTHITSFFVSLLHLFVAMVTTTRKKINEINRTKITERNKKNVNKNKTWWFILWRVSIYWITASARICQQNVL